MSLVIGLTGGIGSGPQRRTGFLSLRNNGRAIMATQIARQQRLQQADDVIANDSSLAHLQQQVEALHQKYLALADEG
jgi:dephospho-CoA kinase